jgi:hypothetical protein
MSLLKTVFGIQANMQGTFFTLMKALRMLRLLKISRQYDGSIVIVRALKVCARRRRASRSPLES